LLAGMRWNQFSCVVGGGRYWTLGLVAVCTVFNSWWWTERPSETCRVLLQ